MESDGRKAGPGETRQGGETAQVGTMSSRIQMSLTSDSSWF